MWAIQSIIYFGFVARTNLSLFVSNANFIFVSTLGDSGSYVLKLYSISSLASVF